MPSIFGLSPSIEARFISIPYCSLVTDCFKEEIIFSMPSLYAVLSSSLSLIPMPTCQLSFLTALRLSVKLSIDVVASSNDFIAVLTPSSDLLLTSLSATISTSFIDKDKSPKCLLRLLLPASTLIALRAVVTPTIADTANAPTTIAPVTGFESAIVIADIPLAILLPITTAFNVA